MLSATALTWASYATKLAVPLAVLPLATRVLPLDQVALWLLLGSVGTVIRLADFGFHATFARLIALSAGSVPREDAGVPAVPGRPYSLGVLDQAMRAIYVRLTVLTLSAAVVLGTAALWRPIQALGNPVEGWRAWGFALGGAAVMVSANRFSAYLVGVDRIRRLRGAELVLNLCEAATVLSVLALGHGLAAMVGTSQVSALVRAAWLRHLARRAGRVEVVSGSTMTHADLRRIWAMAWRSGAGAVMTLSAVRGSGLALAQVAEPTVVASYVLAVTAIEALSTVSQVPLFTSLPTLARMHAGGERAAEVMLAKQRFRLSMWTFVVGAVVVAVAADPVLRLLGSTVGFVPLETWSLFALGFFFHRYGALHIQLYSLTNHIVSHVADGTAAVVAVVVAGLAFPAFGPNALPLGFVAGYAGFYIWYCARHSYRAFELRPFDFEPSVSVLPLVVLMAGLLSSWR